MDGELHVLKATTRPERVRIAQDDDSGKLYDFLMIAGVENAMAPVYESCVRDMIKKTTARDGSIVGIIDGTTAIAGSIGLTFGKWWYTNEWHVEELWCFVHPDYRRGSSNKGHAQALLDFAKWWAEQMGLPLLQGVLSLHRTEGKVRLYQRCLGGPAGALFLYRPQVVPLNG